MKTIKSYAENIVRTSINLTLSENPLGCSPLVLETLKSLSMDDISRYPLLDKLKSEISKHFGVSIESVLLGCGSEQLIKLITQTFLSSVSSVLIQPGSFPLFSKESLLMKSKLEFLGLNTQAEPDLVFIANPNNTNGEAISSKEISKLARSFLNSIVVIDEANGEFLKESFLKKATKSKNCIVLRSFSKVQGLAGLRVGFAVGPVRLVRKLSKSQQPFPISSLSARLAAVSLRDKKFVKRSILFFEKERKFLFRELKKLGFDVSKSITNNIFVSIKNSLALQKELSKKGVSVIDSTFFPGINKPGFRISIKDRVTNEAFLNSLRSIVLNTDRRYY